jgi:hypothetical protein
MALGLQAEKEEPEASQRRKQWLSLVGAQSSGSSKHGKNCDPLDMLYVW